MRLTTGEQLREISQSLKQDQRNYLHEVEQGKARIAELEAELAATVKDSLTVGKAQMARDSAELRRLCAERDQLKAKCVALEDYAAAVEKSAEKLEAELATLKADRDDQYNMKVKAREQRDKVTELLKAKAKAAVPFAYHKKYMGGTDFMLHEPWCEDGISPEWEPLYAAAPTQPHSDGEIVPRELLERVAKPVLFTSQEDSHYDACTELRALLGGEA